MRQKHLTFSIVFLVLLCSIIALVAFSQQKSRLQLEAEMEAAKDNLYNPAYGAYPIYKSAFDELESAIKTFIENHEKLKGIKLSTKLDPVSQLIDGIDKNLQVKHLSDAMKTQLASIEMQQNWVAFLWLEVQKAWYAYYDAVGAYNYGLSPEEQIGITAPEKETETPLWFCAGSCDELFTTEALARVSHQVYCSEKHGTSGTTGVTYYICSASGTCDRSAEHWIVCGGTCGEKFAPKKINRGQGNYNYVANSPHYVKCEKSVYSFWNPNATCGKEYYTCEHSTCPDGNTHWSNVDTSPPQATDNTPNCPDCTNHCSSPCRCSNSGTCNGSVYTAPSDNTPDCSYCTDGCSACPPQMVACGGAAWTGCTASVSSRTEHKVSSCSNCGNHYWTCMPDAVDRHTDVKTCKRSGCGATLTRCQNGPGLCVNGGYHWL